MPQVPIRLRLHAVTWEAEGVLVLELRAPDGADLPAFTAGAHVDLQLAPGLSRSYSLINSQGERHRYVIAVQKDRASRGGSRFVHETLRVGDLIVIGMPVNNFPLAEDSRHVALIAGGIGITPLWAMVQRLRALQRSWNLVYCARTRNESAFYRSLAGLQQAGEDVRFNFDGEPGGRVLDIAKVVTDTPEDTDLYCCGPASMLVAFEKATRDRPSQRVHVEYFGAKQAEATGGGYEVVLKRSGRSLYVEPGSTILQAALNAGVAVPFSCTAGVCGTCETRVLEGVPDHRDAVLSDAERAANASMMICCSGSRSPRLVLDL